MKWRNLKPVLILLILFGSFHLFYDVIYENHLGEGTDSDILYPYLFARDFWTGGWEGVRGWNLPPCTTIFPDLIYAILAYPIVSSIYWFHLVFGFLVFCLPYALARSLGLAKRFSYLVSLGFFMFAGLDPNQLGQFYFPSFHAMTFFFVIWTLFELDHWNPKKGKVWFRFLLLMTLVWVSEYWFFINFSPFLIFYALVRLRWQSVGPLSMGFVGYHLAKYIGKGLRWLGIGTMGSDNLSHLTKLMNTFHSILIDPNSVWQTLVHSVSNQEVLSEWFYWYLVIGSLFVLLSLFRNQGKDFFLDFVFYLSPLISIFILYTIQIEPNIRYFYILPFGILYFSFRLLERIPFIRFGIPIVLVFGCFWYYLGKHSELTTMVKAGETKRNHRLECLSEFDPNLPGAATYWPIKYSYAFSHQKWTLVPFTKDGLYYPWVANSTWDGNLKNQSFVSFSWGVTESKENLENWKGVRLVKACEGWYFFRRN
ncbi:hypothetical protein [Leptospira bandrabouensis]|uniref:hypothetical protein n=1 Tax=Leptospira bandrabouensis TaxID=2484903 RepID=UPI001EE9BCC6|nr:hypothetical protein [Leptospira bandrabouensis]MCG6150678.1 hypothetical protein [Leptospira bandrabouensis]